MNSFVEFNSYVNVNSIKIEKIKKEEDEQGNISLYPINFEEATDSNFRDKTSINTILFTTFNVSDEKSVDAYYFPPENQLSNAVVSIYRKTPDQKNYDFVCELKNGEYQINDYNIKSNQYYHYLISALSERNGPAIAQKYKYYIYEDKDSFGNDMYYKHKFEDWSICTIIPTKDPKIYEEIGYVWNLGGNLSVSGISRNYGLNSWDTLGKYAKFSQGKKNYDSGQFSGLLGAFKEYKKYEVILQEGKQTLVPNNVYEYTEKLKEKYSPFSIETEKLDAWRIFSTDGELKLLKDTKGNAWIIQIIDSLEAEIDYTSNIKQTKISFNWKEAKDINQYSIIGKD